MLTWMDRENSPGYPLYAAIFTVFLSEADNHLYATTLFLVRLSISSATYYPCSGFLSYLLLITFCVFILKLPLKWLSVAALLFCLVLIIFEHLLFWIRECYRLLNPGYVGWLS